MLEAARDRTSESVQPRILHRREGRNAISGGLEYFPRAVGAAIVYHDNFVWHIMEPKLDVQMFHSRCDAAFFIPSGNNYREQSQCCLFSRCASHVLLEISSHSGCASACCAISSRICWSERAGSQFHCRPARVESNTIQGTS